MNDFLSLGVKLTDAEVIKKLDILRLERGISTHSFVIRSIAEKLRTEGYLNAAKIERKTPVRKPSAEIGEEMLKFRIRNMSKK